MLKVSRQSVSAKKSWQKHPNMGGQAIRSGEFGESFIAYLLSQQGVNVARANTVGFDLFAIDSAGKILPKDEIVGISVKARLTQSSPTIPIGSRKVRSAIETWHVKAWIAIVVGDKEKRLTAYAFPFEDCSKLKGKSKREDVISVSELDRKSASGDVRLLF